MSCLSRIIIGTGKTKETEVCVRKIPWRRKWQPTLVLLSENSHGQRSLTSYSRWGCKESDMTEHYCVWQEWVCLLSKDGWCPKRLHSYKERPWDHKVAAGRYCSEYYWCCSWVWYSSKKVQVPSGAETCLTLDSQWSRDSVFVCLHHDYSMIISACHCSLCPVFKNFRLSLFLYIHYYLTASCSQHVPLSTVCLNEVAQNPLHIRKLMRGWGRYVSVRNS